MNGVLQGYGLTESTMAVTVIPFHCPKLGSCGKVLPGIAIKIVDCLTGENLGATHVGEFCIKGGMIMKGYFGNLEATRNTIKEDWLFTGDLGYYDEEGYIYIVDRLKELIKYKGFQVKISSCFAFRHVLAFCNWDLFVLAYFLKFRGTISQNMPKDQTYRYK